MKKAIALFLLLIISVHIGGTFLIFKYQQHRVRKEIKRKLKLGVPDPELNFILVNHTNRHLLEWMHSREFRYQGTMYDIIRKKVIDENTIEYCCINDKKEASLFAHLDEEVNKNMQNRGQAGNASRNLLKLISFPFQLPEINENITIVKELTRVEAYHLISTTFFLEIPSPPPEWV